MTNLLNYHYPTIQLMTDLSDLKTGLSKLGLSKSLVIAHASLKAFGHIEGGAETMLNALLDSVRGIIMPTFTYMTMLNPEVGPPQQWDHIRKRNQT